MALQFDGPSENVIEERRELFCLEEEDFKDLLPTRNVIGHNSWICRTSLLDDEVLSDPQIEWAEDVYFMVLMAGRTRFGFTAMPTATWRWRSTTKDNWTLTHSDIARQTSLARWQRRLQSVMLPSHNKVPSPSDQNDINRAVKRDLS
jgi:hypothetical protein